MLDRNGWWLHLPDCKRAPADAEPIRAGEIVTGPVAPRSYVCCYPQTELLLGA